MAYFDLHVCSFYKLQSHFQNIKCLIFLICSKKRKLMLLLIIIQAHIRTDSYLETDLEKLYIILKIQLFCIIVI